MLLGIWWPWWLLAAAALGGLFLLLRRVLPELEQYGQAMFGMVSALAIIAAGALYYMERRDKPKLQFTIKSDAIRIGRAGQRQSEVLLKLVVMAENRDTRLVTIQCLASDFSGLPAGEPLVRDPGSASDMTFTRLWEAIPYDRDDGGDIRHCLEVVTKKWGPKARPTFMWPELLLEPGQADDVYFEKPISCEYSLVRVLVKVRVRPEDRYGYETKVIVPLTDLCRGEGGIRESVTSSTVEAA